MTVEIRVHGIGDHEPLSALGSGLPLNDVDFGGAVEGYEAPPVPNHTLWLLN